MYKVSDLMSGDCILYEPGGLFGFIIAIKTWHNVGHVEVYTGHQMSVASRNGLGVNVYPVNLGNIAAVLRPDYNFNLVKAIDWYMTVKGQKYDWLGLIRFSWRSRVIPDGRNNKQFCSEFATRFYRAGGLQVFNYEDADSIAPFQFALDNHFSLVVPKA